jgi:hypothetical protein
VTVTTSPFTVSVIGVADAPTTNAENASGNEDSAINLDLSAAVTDSSEILSIQIASIPSGASVSHGTLSGGVWTIDPADLGTVSITPPENFSGVMSLHLKATSLDGSDTAVSMDAFTVTVAGIADAASLVAANVSGTEDSAIALNLSATLTDVSETLSVQITGIPVGGSLSSGTDLGGGIWSVNPTDLSSLTLTPPADFSGTISLGLQATSADGNDSASSTASFSVTVAGVADAPTASAGDVSGAEDSAIALSLTAALTGASELLNVQIIGVPAGASLSAGADLGGGVWSIDPADLASLTLTPPADFSGTINMQLRATSTDGSDTANTTDTFTVTVSGVADTPVVSAQNVSGNEDSAISLDLSAAASDGSEALTVQVTGFPSGTTVSHGTITAGVWTIDPADLSAVSITPPSHFSGQMNLQIGVTSTDGADTTTATTPFGVTVAAVADAPTAAAENVSGNEDTPITFNASAGLVDSGETLSIQITGVPAGAALSAGTDLGGGVWSVTGLSHPDPTRGLLRHYQFAACGDQHGRPIQPSAPTPSRSRCPASRTRRPPRRRTLQVQQIPLSVWRLRRRS